MSAPSRPLAIRLLLCVALTVGLLPTVAAAPAAAQGTCADPDPGYTCARYPYRWCPHDAGEAVLISYCRRGMVSQRPTPGELSVSVDGPNTPAFGRVGGHADQDFVVIVPAVDRSEVTCLASPRYKHVLGFAPIDRCLQFDRPRYDANLVIDHPTGYVGHAEDDIDQEFPDGADFRYEMIRTVPATASRSAGWQLTMDFANTAPTGGAADPGLAVAFEGDFEVRTWEIWRVYTGCYADTRRPSGPIPSSHTVYSRDRCAGGDQELVANNYETVHIAESQFVVCRTTDGTFEVIHPSVTS